MAGRVGQIFGQVLRPQTLRRPHGAHDHFPVKIGPKVEIRASIYNEQSIDNSILKFHAKFYHTNP